MHCVGFGGHGWWVDFRAGVRFRVSVRVGVRVRVRVRDLGFGQQGWSEPVPKSHYM